MSWLLVRAACWDKSYGAKMTVGYAVVKLPVSGHLQLFIGGETLYQTGTNLDSWSAASTFVTVGPAHDSAAFNSLAACTQEDGAPQVWGISSVDLGFYTAYKPSPAEGAAWKANKFTPAPPTTAGQPIGAIAAGRGPAGPIQLFAGVPNAADAALNLITTWQVEENSQEYFGWSDMNGAPALAMTENPISASNLADGRVQLWVITSSNKLMTVWKPLSVKNAPWGLWDNASTQPPGAPTAVTAGIRADGRNQIWCVIGGKLFTTIQETSPSAAIESWTEFDLPAGAVALDIRVAKLNDSRLQLFLYFRDGGEGGSYTCFQNDTTANATWSVWYD
jgi:hypothetical protein